ncbi:MAG: thiamine pyrophosphate-binding protein, partial [Gammaproteobacteria bacterium]|nr:thiamine pyrophosphate-binding protein [Gammaproteobacteria bacterium]
ANLASVKLKGVATATGCEYLRINNNHQLVEVIEKAFTLGAESKAVIVDVNIDYSKATCFTDGVVKTNIKRLPTDTKVRMVTRAVYRKLVD